MAPPTATARVRRTQEERSAETRARLLDATIHCLIELGYSATTTTVIAERAGVSRGAQLHHFPTKAQLVSAAVEHLSTRIGKELHDEVAELRAEENHVASAVDLLWSRFSTALFPAWLELLVASRTDGDLREHLDAVEKRMVRASQRRIEEMFGDAVRQAPGYSLAIELTLSLMNGLALEHAVAPASARRTKRREEALLAEWKRVLPAILSATSPSRAR